MKTLKELFDEYGSVWLAGASTPNIKRFKPLAYSEDGEYIIGELEMQLRDYEDQASCDCLPNETGFVLYQESKQKKRYYAYAIKYKDDNYPVMTTYMYCSDEEFKKSGVYELNSKEMEWFKKVEPGIGVSEFIIKE